jgi:hypothetical protein
MRTRHVLSLASALLAISLASACASNPSRNQESYSVRTGEWDSRTLDREYKQRLTEMERRHREEIAHARSNESAEQREARQAAERQDLEDRYRRAREHHMNRIPDSNGHDNDQGGRRRPSPQFG